MAIEDAVVDTPAHTREIKPRPMGLPPILRHLRFFKTPLLFLIAAAYLVPIVWTLHRVGDEGTLMYGAERVSEGAIPGRDFLEVMGPGSFYWLGLFFRLFGLGWSVSRFLVLFTGLATAGLVYDIARKVCREAFAVVVWMFVVAVSLPLWPTVSHHWDSNLFAVAAIWSYLKLESTGRAGWAVPTGILAGVTACIMQPKGLLLLGALIISDIICRLWPTPRRGDCAGASDKTPRSWTPMWLLSGSFAVVGFAVIMAYWKAGALKGLYYANVTWPMKAYQGVNSGSYWTTFLAVPLSPVWRTLGPDRFVAGFLCTGLSLIPFLILAILPLIVVGMVTASCANAHQHRLWITSPLMALTLAGGAIWLSEIHRKDVFHFVFGSPVLLIVMFAGAQRMNVLLRRIFLGAVAAGLIMFSAFTLITHLHDRHSVETRRGTIQSVSANDALRFLCTSVNRREPVFVYPYYPSLYYLADVRNPTRFSILLYGYNTPQQFDEVIRDLEQQQVRYILWDQELYGEKLRTYFPGYRHPPAVQLKLEHYIQARYDSIGVKSGFQILRRRLPGLP